MKCRSHAIPCIEKLIHFTTLCFASKSSSKLVWTAEAKTRLTREATKTAEDKRARRSVKDTECHPKRQHFCSLCQKPLNEEGPRQPCSYSPHEARLLGQSSCLTEYWIIILLAEYWNKTSMLLLFCFKWIWYTGSHTNIIFGLVLNTTDHDGQHLLVLIR